MHGKGMVLLIKSREKWHLLGTLVSRGSGTRMGGYQASGASSGHSLGKNCKMILPYHLCQLKNWHIPWFYLCSLSQNFKPYFLGNRCTILSLSIYC